MRVPLVQRSIIYNSKFLLKVCHDFTKDLYILIRVNLTLNTDINALLILFFGTTLTTQDCKTFWKRNSYL